MFLFEIIPVRGHYEVYDYAGNFVCSADSYSEAMFEVQAA